MFIFSLKYQGKRICKLPVIQELLKTRLYKSQQELDSRWKFLRDSIGTEMSISHFGSRNAFFHLNEHRMRKLPLSICIRINWSTPKIKNHVYYPWNKKERIILTASWICKLPETFQKCSMSCELTRFFSRCRPPVCKNFTLKSLFSVTKFE